MAACFVSAHSIMDTPLFSGDTVHGARNRNDEISSLPFVYVKLHFYTSTILYSCHFVVYLCQNNFFCVSVIFAVSSDLLYASNKSLFHT